MAICNRCQDGIDEDNGQRCQYCDGTGYVPDEDGFEFDWDEVEEEVKTKEEGLWLQETEDDDDDSKDPNDSRNL